MPLVTEPTGTPLPLLAEAERPQFLLRFRLRHALIATTLVATLLGLLAPWLRTFSALQWQRLSISGGLNVLGFAVGYIHLSWMSRKVVSSAEPLRFRLCVVSRHRWIYLIWIPTTIWIGVEIEAAVNGSSWSTTLLPSFGVGMFLAAAWLITVTKHCLWVSDSGILFGNVFTPWKSARWGTSTSPTSIELFLRWPTAITVTGSANVIDFVTNHCDQRSVPNESKRN